MSLDADALAEMARNRGLKLKRSRVRTEGKPGFGMFGLVDAEESPVFGIRGKRALRASAEEIADFLRKGEASDWKASLKAAGGRPRSRPAPSAAPTKRAPAPKPPEPVTLRDAGAADADALAVLFALLGHQVDAKAIRRNLLALAKAGEAVLVAARGKTLLGACGLHRMVAVHRDWPVGRITILVVAEEARDRGIGRMLAEEAERRLARLGCGLIEVTSNDRLTAAHAFWRHLGFERTSMRFAKSVASG